MLIKKYLILLSFLFVSRSYANDPHADAMAKMPQTLKNGTADYQTVTLWVEDYLASNNYTENPILPVKLSEEMHCHDSQWILIEDTPASGQNRSYFLFSKKTNGDQAQYRYLGEIEASRHILFCFKSGHSYILELSHMSGVETGVNLAKITNFSLVHIGKPIIKINTENNSRNALWEKVFTKKISEKELVDIFQWLVK